jgi:DNA-directed RNA polymerase subunit M/transcription elongation factor TFIIS
MPSISNCFLFDVLVRKLKLSMLRSDLSAFLSKDTLQRYDEIQRLSFYLMVNEANLAKFSAPELLVMPEEMLIKGSEIEVNIEKHKRKIEEYEQFVTQDIFGTEGIKCRKCGHIVQATAKQTRSADEGATIFVRCENCETRFKMS